MIYAIIRIILGLLFVVSGWVKAIDPIGISYKISDYAAAFNIEWIGDISMPIAILLCGMELFIGLMLIFKLWEKVISYITFLFLSFFTLLTICLVVIPGLSVEDCGCFGDAITLTNAQTLAKNIVFVTLSFFYARRIYHVSIGKNTKYYYSTAFMSGRKKRQLKFSRFVVYLYIFLFSITVPLYSAFNLPPYTYLPFDTGANLRDINKGVDDEETKTELVYENILTKEKKTFNVDDTEWHDESKWRYVETITSGGGNESGKMNLTIYDADNNNATDEIIQKKSYTFMVIAQNIKELSYSEMMSLNSLHDMYKGGKINLIVATSSSPEVSNVVLDSYGWQTVNTYNIDIVELKSLIRSHKGVILIDDGIISGKWNLPDKIFKNIDYNDIKPLISWERNAIYVYLSFIGLFFALMLYLVILYHTIRR